MLLQRCESVFGDLNPTYAYLGVLYCCAIAHLRLKGRSAYMFVDEAKGLS